MQGQHSAVWRDESVWLRGFLVCAGLVVAAVVAMPAPAGAQGIAGAEVWGGAGCGTCHGTLATGGEDPAEPVGPNLRISRLDRAGFVETIACGRPGTPMPFNLQGAYTEVSCYGLPPGDVPAEVRGAGGISAEELEDLVSFLMEHVVGQRRVTRDNCALFFGGNPDARACQAF